MTYVEELERVSKAEIEPNDHFESFLHVAPVLPPTS
jgi:hypothetical protein